WSEDPYQVANHESQAAEYPQSPYDSWQIARSNYQVPQEHGSDAVEHDEEAGASGIDAQREHSKSVEWRLREGLQVPIPSQDEGGREVEELSERKGGGGHEAEQEREQGQVRVDRSQQDIEEKGQGHIGDGLSEIDDKAQTEEELGADDVV